MEYNQLKFSNNADSVRIIFVTQNKNKLLDISPYDRNKIQPFITPKANPAAKPPASGMPKFPLIVEICPMSVNE